MNLKLMNLMKSKTDFKVKQSTIISVSLGSPKEF